MKTMLKSNAGRVILLDTNILQTVARIEERIKDHDRRITKNENLTEQIHKLAASVETLSSEIKRLNENREKALVSIDARLKEHGERIGAQENKGSKKLEGIAGTIVTVLVTAVIMYFIGNLGSRG